MKQHATTAKPPQVYREKVNTMPVLHDRTIRRDQISVVTSSFGGKLVPIKMIPLLREDGMRRSTVRIACQMAETSEMLLNPVRVSAMAFFVPKLALDRFQDMGQIDRSYNKLEEKDGSVIPWFEPAVSKTNDLFTTLGLHTNANDEVNSDYIESYNAIWNYIATQRSPDLTLRALNDTTLAPAFWEHTQMKHVKPKFDDALIDGEIPLTVTNSQQTLYSSKFWSSDTALPAGWRMPAEQGDPAGEDGRWMWEDIWTELDSNAITVSLANIDLARETAAWARLRNTYQGLSEEWMMDQLLQGIRIPDQSLRQPILLAHSDTLVGMSQRYATDAANLDKSMTDGRTEISLNIAVPATTCGGTVVILAQALPEQIYERQRDHFLTAMDQDLLPNRTRDELDPQPVEIVKNVHVDEAHSFPEDLFGYEPLNAKWQRVAPNVGGKYFQPDPNAPWTEVRNRIWDANVVDPQLGPDFYMATTLQHKVFASEVTDPFEWWATGDCIIEGLTFFGPALHEGVDDYDKVLEQVDTSRLVGDGTDTAITVQAAEATKTAKSGKQEE